MKQLYAPGLFYLDYMVAIFKEDKKNTDAQVALRPTESDYMVTGPGHLSFFKLSF